MIATKKFRLYTLLLVAFLGIGNIFSQQVFAAQIPIDMSVVPAIGDARDRGTDLDRVYTSDDDGCNPEQKLATYEGDTVYFRLLQPLDDYFWHWENTSMYSLYNSGVFLGSLQLPYSSNLQVAVGTPNTPGDELLITDAIGSTFGKPTTERGEVAAQIVLQDDLRRLYTSDTATSRSYFYTNHSDQFYNYTLKTDRMRDSVAETMACLKYYVAYCGDGTIDNPSRAGCSDGTDGCNGIATDDEGFVEWFGQMQVTPAETCDEGDLNGTPGHCNLTCNGMTAGGGVSCPTNLAVAPTNGTAGVATTFNFTWVANTSYSTISIAGPGISAGTLGVAATSYSLPYTPASAGTLTYNLLVSSGTDSQTCPFPAVSITGAVTSCGNGTLEGTEQCDDGNILDNDGCSSSCVLETPTCTLTGAPNPVFVGNPVTFNATKPSWAHFLTFTPGSLPPYTIGPLLLNPVFPLQRTYYSPGTYTASTVVQSTYAGPINTGSPRPLLPSSSCSTNIQVIQPCVLILSEPYVNTGEAVAIQWQVNIPFIHPAWIFVDPPIVGGGPYNVIYNTGTAWSIPTNNGIYTFTLSGMDIHGVQFGCTATLAVGVTQGNLAIDKTITTTGNYGVGDEVGFRIHFANYTEYTLDNVTIRDIMPRALGYVSSSINGVSSANYGAWEEYGYWIVEYSGITLAPNQEGDLYLTGIVRPNPQFGESTNVSLIYDSHFSGSDAVYVDLGPTPYVQLTQSINGGAFTESDLQTQIGDTVVYKIVFGNSGAIGTTGGVNLYNYLPKGIQYVSSWISLPGVVTTTGLVGPLLLTGISVDPSLELRSLPIGPSYFWSTDAYMYTKFANFNLAGGQGGYAIITGIVTPAYQYTRYLDRARMYTYHPVRLATDQVIAYRLGDVSITKTATAGSSYYPGDPLDFIITVTNYSTGTLSNISVTDTWPNSTCIIYSGRALATGTFTSPSAMTWTYGSTLTPGQSASFHVYGSVANSTGCVGSYVNTATSTYQGVDNGSVSAQFPFTVVERPFATIQLTKQADMTSATQGEVITYTITYRNAGNTTINSYTVVDQFPGTLDFVSATPIVSSNTATSYGRALQWNFTTPLAPGSGGTITVKGTVR